MKGPTVVSAVQAPDFNYPKGFAPRTPRHARSRAAAPARAVRVAHSLPLVRGRRALVIRRASPLGLPDTLARAPLRRRAPFAWRTRCRSFAVAGPPRLGL